MSILEDYDHDSEDAFAEITSLEEEMIKIFSITHQIDTHGLDQTSTQLLGITGLLSSVSLEAIALESNTDEIRAQIAVESLIDTLKEKAASWSSKILDFFSSTGTNFFSGLGNILSSIKDKFSRAKESLGQSISNGLEYAKVHPVESVIKAIGACAATISILIFAGRMLPVLRHVTKLLPLAKSIIKMINGIKWPFGPIKAFLSKNSRRIVLDGGAVIGAGALVKLAHVGWTSSSANEIEHGLERVYHDTERAWNTFKPKIITGVNETVAFSKTVASATKQGTQIGYDALYNEREEPKEFSERSLLLGTARLGTAVIGGSVMFFVTMTTSILYALFKLMRIVIGGTFRLGASCADGLLNPKSKDYV